ncbi:ZmpA/ZmpB/ZmpC family metallo-endopeptidase [Streptococcus himalayensis]|uniref:G5 domain-containing protein n=1 Tax=Streptococcus himalayensis TaxID=1888195 RepID=A0A917EFC3_9STRE|nr:ZmpA/ZmpB/ZmpC family metallo-endopeptidase [Streptococcus himalayensis]GGE27765.1 hypothetical protein GCM10011510_06170 [Streptococcus himalayensis]
MKELFEKQRKFSIRKLAIGVVSAMIGLMMIGSLASTTVYAEQTAQVISGQTKELDLHYVHVLESDLTNLEQAVVKDEEHFYKEYARDENANFILVYQKKDAQSLLPRTGGVLTNAGLVIGGASLLYLIVIGRKNRKKAAAFFLLTTVLGGQLPLTSVSALEQDLKAIYAESHKTIDGQTVLAPEKERGDLRFVGYITQKDALQIPRLKTLLKEYVPNIEAGVSRLEGGSQGATQAAVSSLPNGIAEATSANSTAASQVVVPIYSTVPQHSEILERQPIVPATGSVGSQILPSGLPTVSTSPATSKEEDVIEVPVAVPSEETVSPVPEFPTPPELSDEEIVSEVPVVVTPEETVSPVPEFSASPELSDEEIVSEVPVVVMPEKTVAPVPGFSTPPEPSDEEIVSEAPVVVTPEETEAPVPVPEFPTSPELSKEIPSETISEDLPVSEPIKPVIPEVVIGSIEEVVTEDIPYDFIQQEDEQAWEDEISVSEGEVGQKATTITYETVNGQKTGRILGSTEVILKSPVSKIVTKGTKPLQSSITETSVIAISASIREVEDDTLWEGDIQVIEGQAGEKTVTTIYETIRGEKTGVILSMEEEQTVASVDRIIVKGTKPLPGRVQETEVLVIPRGRRQEEDDTLWADETKIIEGQDGEKIITKIYETNKGIKTDTLLSITETLIRPAVDTIVVQGVKPLHGSVAEVTREIIPHGTRTELDSTLWVDESRMEEGRDGEKEVTTTYETVRGEKTAKVLSTTENVLRPAIDTVVYQGTKPLLGSVTEVTGEIIPHGTRTELDSTLWADESRMEEGRDGEKEVTTTYETVRGEKTAKVLSTTENVLRPAIDTVVYQGIKPLLGSVTEVTREVIPRGRRQEEDDTLWADESRREEGRDGEKEVTTTYETVRGEKTAKVLSTTENVLRPAIDTVVYQGIKPLLGSVTEVTREVIPRGQRQEEDDTLWADESRREEGRDGEKEVTTTYETIRGEKTTKVLSTTENVLRPAIDTVIYKGTKRHVKPSLTIQVVQTDLDKKSATIYYKLEDEAEAYRSAKVAVFQNGVKIQEVALLNNRAQFTKLDYNIPYTIVTSTTYDLGKGQQVEELTNRREFELEYKKIELKAIDSVELYSRENQRERRHLSLERIPANLDHYFVKIKSSKFKEMLLPVSSIQESRHNGVPSYKVQIAFDELVEDVSKDLNYKDGYHFYIEKAISKPGVITSFQGLMAAIQANPAGHYVLGADISADDWTTTDATASYISRPFTGSLYGASDGRKFAIYHLKKPLFATLDGAIIQNLDLKEVAIETTVTNVGALASIAQGNASISDVSAQGDIVAAGDIGGLIATMKDGAIINNASFAGSIRATTKQGTSNVGGLVGYMTGKGTLLEKGQATVAISVSASSNNQRTGGLVGMAVSQAHLKNSTVSGYIVNSGTSGQTGGVVGSTWSNGMVDSIISGVGVTGGHILYGDTGYVDANVKNVFSINGKAFGRDDSRGRGISEREAASKITTFGITTNLADSDKASRKNQYQVDYTSVKYATANRAIAYENIEKLLPFYNKDLIVRYGNQVSPSSKLYTTKLVDVVPMKNNEVVIHVQGQKQQVNRLMLHYADGTVEYARLAYKGDFAEGKLAEYTLGDTGLLYTPEVFLSSYQSILNRVLPQLNAITYRSEAIQQTLGIPASVTDEVVAAKKKELENAKQRTPDLVIPSNQQLKKDIINERLSRMFLEDSFNEVKGNLAQQLQKVLATDKSINTLGKAVSDSIVQKISDNKEALLLGLSYLNRWYGISYGNVNTKDLTSFKLDFFGNQNVSTLDGVISLGKLGYDLLQASNNVHGYANGIGRWNGKADIFSLLESYRERFLPEKNNNDWFKEATKAYVVESYSQIPEVEARQKAAYGNKRNKASIGIYDQLSRSTWTYQNMLLPLLTMTQESVYIISNMNTLSFGGYERYRNSLTPENRAEIRAMVDQTAIWQRNHFDFYYKILNASAREKLFKQVLNYDGFNYLNADGKVAWETLLSDAASIKEFFGPVGKYYGHNGSSAYASGIYTHFVADKLLGQTGTSIYTHEMVHNNDSEVYFGGYGRREGQGAELYALGLLQAPSEESSAWFSINSLFEFDKDSTKRYHAANPVERFKNTDDVNQYIKGMMDVVYLMDYVEGQAILKQSNEVKKKWLRKIENYYVTDSKYKIETHAGNTIRELTNSEVAQLRTFSDLIDHSILTKRLGLQDGQHGRNGYFTISLFAPIYSALDNPKGSPGDIMFRRMAYELFAEKGYYGGFVPYVSGQYGPESLANGSKSWSDWLQRDVGRVTDTMVLEKVFKGQYKNWTDFKKAMYRERVNQLPNLKPITIKYDLGRFYSQKTVTISSYEQLQSMIEEAMAYDIRNIDVTTNYPSVSWVDILKRSVYNAYLRSTDDFRESIFEQNSFIYASSRHTL